MPAIGERRDMRIERGPCRLNQRRERIGEIAILALAETMARHVNMASEGSGGAIERRHPIACRVIEQAGQHRPALLIEAGGNRAPVIGGDMRGKIRMPAHATPSMLISLRLRGTPQR
jgi:hypothetical protein